MSLATWAAVGPQVLICEAKPAHRVGICKLLVGFGPGGGGLPPPERRSVPAQHWGGVEEGLGKGGTPLPSQRSSYNSTRRHIYNPNTTPTRFSNRQ